MYCVEAWGFFPTKAWLYTKKLKETVHCESDDCIELVAKQLVKSLLWEMSIIMVWHNVPFEVIYTQVAMENRQES